MKQSKKYNVNIGGATVLLVLVVFALTVFAVLSLRASYQELSMARLSNQSIQRFYKVDSIAEEIYAKVCEIINKIGTEEGTGDALLDQLSKEDNIGGVRLDKNSQLLTYEVQADYNEILEVKLQLPKENQSKVSVYSWKLIWTGNDEYESETADIWDGLLD